MMSEIHSSETPSAADLGGYDHQSFAPIDLVADAIKPTSYELNMFNCYKHRQHLFNRCKDGIIHRDLLISSWMMSGYLSPAASVDEAHKKGNRLLRDLIQVGLLKPSDEDPDMIELARTTCGHGLTPCDATNVGFVEMLDVDRIDKLMLTDGMMKQRNLSDDGNYLCRQVFQSQRGLKYIAHFNPTPNTLNPLLETVKNPSVLMLRGFDDHLFPLTAFTFENFKTLTVLEISGLGIPKAVPLYPTISKLTQLQYLYLSDPQIYSLPEDLFSKLLKLRWLILRGCSLLDFHYNLSHLRNLEVLDLSYTSTTQIPAIEAAGNLTHLFLRDSALRSYQVSHTFLKNLKFVDLSGNQIGKSYNWSGGDQLVVLDLSRTKTESGCLEKCPLLRNLILRECTSLNEFSWSWKNPPTNLEVLDVSGCENLQLLPEDQSSFKSMKELNLAGCSCLPNLREGFFDQMSSLLKLDLSQTKFKWLPSLANLISLRELTLRGLELDSLKVEAWTSFPNLVKLDLHGLKISTLEELNLDFLPSLLKLQTLDLLKTSVSKLPDISNLVSLKELLLADCWNLKALPDLEPLTSLETLDVSLPDDPTRSCQLQVQPETQRVLPPSLRRLVVTNRPIVQSLFPRVPSSRKSENLQGQRTISKAIEFHIVNDVGHTGFDRFIYEFERIDALILEIQRSSTKKTANTNSYQATYFERQFEMIYADMKYIEENIDRLKGSRDNKISEELLRKLVDAATHLSAADFKNDSQNLKLLLRLFVRLKLLFPFTPTNDHKASKADKKKKQPLFIYRLNRMMLKA